jgi:spore coat protein U-like protein
MKKTILVLAGVASMLASVPAAQANTVGGPFIVTVTLDSKCTMAAIGNLAFGAYTAFQGGVQTATNTTATLTCTRGLGGVTAGFDNNVLNGATGAAAATNAAGAGVLAGLQYDILATPGTPTAGAVASATSVGSADTLPFVISGTMPAAQAGATPVGAATQTRTLTITY